MEEARRVVGLIGHPVSHSLSPLIQNAAFEHTRFPAVYSLFDVPPENLRDAVRGVRALGLLGVNVTIPHKTSVVEYLDELSSEAARIGAVNTVLNRNGRLIGFNTDCAGLLAALEEANCNVSGSTALVIGAGGAARAAAYTLAAAGARLIVIINRTRARAERLALELEGTGVAQFEVYDFTSSNLALQWSRSDVVVNATSLGLGCSDEAELLMESARVRPGQTVCDLVYDSRAVDGSTRFLQHAARLGAVAVSGLSVLLYQGARSFEIWTGVSAPVEVMRQAMLCGRSALAKQSDNAMA